MSKDIGSVSTVEELREEFALSFASDAFNLRCQELTNQPNAPWLAAGIGRLSLTNNNYFYAMQFYPKTGMFTEAFKTYLDAFDRFMNFGITDAELERLKQAYLMNVQQSYANKENHASANYAGNIVNHFLTGRIYISDDDNVKIATEIINQITADAAAKGLLDAAKQDLEEKGYSDDNPANIALVSGSGTDANQTAWEAAIDELLATDDYDFMKIQNKDTDVLYPGTDETKVNSECATLIGRMGEGSDKIQGAIALSSMSTPALGAQYEAASDKPDASKITLTGLATPNALKTYIKDDTNPLNTGVLWNCADLGYLAIQGAYQMVTGTITSSSTSIDAGRLGEKVIDNKECVLGDALIFDINNVDDFDY